jgi:hypothetical protein
MTAQTVQSAEYELAQHIAEIVATAPPLKPEQRDRIVAILQAGAK